MGCMIGTIRGDAVIAERIAPADVDPAQSTPTRVLPRQTCEDAGWASTVGVIHSHPDGERCFYYFPGTQVATSDAASFARQPYPVDAIMCGHRVVWISRNMAGPAHSNRSSLCTTRPCGPRFGRGRSVKTRR